MGAHMHANWVRDVYNYEQAWERVIQQEGEIMALRKIIKSLDREDLLYDADGNQRPEITKQIKDYMEREGIKPKK